jgi:subtilisin family serine protease
VRSSRPLALHRLHSPRAAHCPFTLPTAAPARPTPRAVGAAKEAEIVAVQGLDCNGTAANSMFIAALDWAVRDALKRGKPAVMTMSLGGDRDELLDRAAQRAKGHGFTVVTASGNDAGDSCDMSPGADPAAISVAASDETDALASYSNYGKCTDIIAPGSSIAAAYVTSRTASAQLSGTSMATPLVAGAVLQLLQKRAHATPTQIGMALRCLSTKGAVTGLSASTVNRLVHTGSALDEGSALLDEIMNLKEGDALPAGCSDAQPAEGRCERAAALAARPMMPPSGTISSHATETDHLLPRSGITSSRH